ncbi:putative phospholipid-transporting ATPase VA [Varanus komodoensis]|nr:putative phospholipid-transporting ATPase VA [Varanus komodoensis]
MQNDSVEESRSLLPEAFYGHTLGQPPMKLYIRKGQMFVALLFWYQFYCGFSGSSMIDQWYLIFFNLLFSSIPQLIVGVLDQDVPADILIAVPQLYTSGQNMEEYKPHMFWMNMIDAFYQSLVCFFIPYFTYYDSDVDIFSWGTPITTIALFTIILHLAIETKTWTWLHLSSCVFSIALFFIVALVYNASCPVCYHPSNPYWIMEKLMKEPMFYLSCLITPAVALLPRFLYRTLQGTLFPSQLQLGRQLSRMSPDTRNLLLNRWNRQKDADLHQYPCALYSPESPNSTASDSPGALRNSTAELSRHGPTEVFQPGNELFQPPKTTTGYTNPDPPLGAQICEGNGHFSEAHAQEETPVGFLKDSLEPEPTLMDETFQWKPMGDPSSSSLLNWITSTPLFNGTGSDVPRLSCRLHNVRQDSTVLCSRSTQDLRSSAEQQNTSSSQQQMENSAGSCLRTESLDTTFL